MPKTYQNPLASIPINLGDNAVFQDLEPGHAEPSPENRPRTGYDDVSPGIFQTLRVPLKKGRFLDDHDTQTAPWVVVVNEPFAKKYFPNENPIGQQILLRYDPYPVDEERPRQIVGVVGDMKHFGLGQETPPFMYASYLQQQACFPAARPCRI